jgi:hypothetical protein
MKAEGRSHQKPVLMSTGRRPVHPGPVRTKARSRSNTIEGAEHGLRLRHLLGSPNWHRVTRFLSAIRAKSASAPLCVRTGAVDYDYSGDVRPGDYRLASITTECAHL